MKLLIVLLLVSGTAWAMEQDHSCQGGFNCNEGTDGQTQQDQSQTQEQTLAPIITAEGGKAEGGSADATGGSSNSTVSVLTEGQKYRNSPTLFAPYSVPTSPCRVAASGGVSILGGAIAAGGSKEDKECTLRETARMFADFGEVNFALSLLCASLAVEREGLFDSCPQVSTPIVDHFNPLDVLVGAMPEEQPEHEVILELQQQQIAQQQQIQQQQQQYVQALEERLKQEESKRVLKEEEDEGVRQLLLVLYGKEDSDE